MPTFSALQKKDDSLSSSPTPPLGTSGRRAEWEQRITDRFSSLIGKVVNESCPPPLPAFCLSLTAALFPLMWLVKFKPPTDAGAQQDRSSHEFVLQVISVF